MRRHRRNRRKLSASAMAEVMSLMSFKSTPERFVCCECGSCCEGVPCEKCGALKIKVNPLAR